MFLPCIPLLSIFSKSLQSKRLLTGPQTINFSQMLHLVVCWRKTGWNAPFGGACVTNSVIESLQVLDLTKPDPYWKSFQRNSFYRAAVKLVFSILHKWVCFVFNCLTFTADNLYSISKWWNFLASCFLTHRCQIFYICSISKLDLFRAEGQARPTLWLDEKERWCASACCHCSGAHAVMQCWESRQRDDRIEEKLGWERNF